MIKNGYLKLSEDENEEFINTNKKIKSRKVRKTLKKRIIEKYIIQKLDLIKCFILFIIIFILLYFYISKIFGLNLNYINHISEIIQNIISKDKDNITIINNITDNNSFINITKNNTENDIISNNTQINKKENISEHNENKANTDIPFDSNKNKSTEHIYKDYKFDSLQESFKKAKNFLEKSSKGILINDKTKFISSEHPIATAIIPVYNSQKIINRAIKSVQNQDLLNIEIILVNDCSTDNSLNIISELQKEDPRIKIITNKKNMGILYSRSIGALSSKGKYIFSLDNDDMFLDFNVFSNITNIAEETGIDIIEFKGVMSRQASNILNTKIYDIWFTSHKNFELYQPELTEYSITVGKTYDSYELNTVFIWCKCVKADIYKKTLEIIGEEKYSRYMIAHEDCVISFALLNIANSYKYVGKYGIYNIVRTGSAITINNRKELLNYIKELYFVDIVVDFEKNTNTFKKVIPAVTFKVLNLKLLEKVITTDIKYKKILYSILDRVLNLDYISKETKNEIIKKGKNLKFLDYPAFNEKK